VAENMQDKTEAPTEKRQKQSRDDGKIPRTPELSAAVGLLGSGLMVGPGGAAMVSALSEILSRSFRFGGGAMGDTRTAVDWLRWTTATAGLGILPFVAVISGLALAVGAGQARGTLTVKPLAPQWSRLSPLKNTKKYLSPRPLVDLIKALFKIAVVAIVVYVAMAGAMERLSTLPQSDVASLVDTVRRQISQVLVFSGFALLALAAADYAYQSWDHNRQLRMTKQEVKQESKEAEGDPLVRARLRSLGRSLARMRMMQAVPTADVVVTNPTFIAVALKYDPDASDAPVVVAMGSRKVALRIREIAKRSGVPMIEQKSVARALFATGQVGLPIPPALYLAVAEILAFVFGHRRSGSGDNGGAS
jgi:flagellar biosynthetic protein FlhB